MDTLILRFTESIFPITTAVLVGFIAQRLITVDSRPVLQIALYIMFPALVFRDISQTDIPLIYSLQIIALAVGLVLIMFAIALLAGRIAGFERRMILAITLTVAFMNAGNIGLAVAESSFGSDGVALASIFFLTCVVLTFVIGVSVAEAGRTSLRRGVQEVLKVPALYAILSAGLVNALGLHLPSFISMPINMLAGGAIPTMLIVLGMQIADSGIPRNWRPLSLAAFLRLVVSPLVAFGICTLLGWQGMLRSVGVLQAGMPTAVLSGVIAAEYDLESDFVASAILVSTLLSPLTLTILLSLLEGV